MSYDRDLDAHILSIVHTQEITEQIDLQNCLKERGYDIPQATLSRKLKKLNIAKVAGVYRVVDFSTPNLPLILNLQVSDSGLIVLHTHPGNASSLALYFDKRYVSYSFHQENTSGILGSIAGDDTVVLILKSKALLNKTLQILQMDFPYLKIPQSR
ncbi:arginine repressor ArgR [Legionella lansingensis]|uniref:Arginine repressor n=1 Tax=Legionella lansingensis TaxID=45067 RepID=A0A0W0VPS6_9GAMM|nr:ArgR family transcriptional regulator [Legionella lansingensis]KTD22110.1 arginine repressor ArgR [Legionella lansingensis]SNV45717.1 arginine repressor ArgR [Legionella lansingensis]